MSASPKLGVRWTIGNVSDRGFEALGLSIRGASRIFGPDAEYAVCVNTVSVDEARRRAGAVPDQIIWHDASRDIPAILSERFDTGMAEGVGWKLAPLRFFADRHELSLDNDCILWALPATLVDWWSGVDPRLCLMSEDVRSCLGQFAYLCGPIPCNAGIRGLPPGFDLEAALREALRLADEHFGRRVMLLGELDEQGLQTAALSLAVPLKMVSLEEVTVCSPFHPHLPNLGCCGAHFVGLNARHIAWDYYDRPADEWMTEHWLHYHPVLQERVKGDTLPTEAPTHESPSGRDGQRGHRRRERRPAIR